MRLPRLRPSIGSRRVILSASILAVASCPAHALTWNVTYGSGLSAGSPERKAFDAGLAFWSSKFADPITVPLTANFGTTTNTNLLGGTSANYYGDAGTFPSYSTVRAALVNDAADEPDDVITGSLPLTFSATVNGGRTLRSTIADLTRTNARALGLVTDAATDGDITFYNKTYYDFDNGNGVTGGKLDFYSTVVHELGHLMGFVSAVDDSIDNIFGDGSVVADPLDFYRFGGNAGGPTAATFGTTSRDLRYDVPAHFDDGLSEFAFDDGNPNQASHWLEAPDNGAAYIGVMDPVQSAGVVDRVTYADYRAFDLIGWDVNAAAAAVPEPTAIAAALAAGATLVMRHRRGR